MNKTQIPKKPPEKKKNINKKKGELTTINWNDFDKLCNMQATQIEIASWFNVSVDTIENIVKREKHELFSEYYKKKSVKGKMALRRKQMEIAMEGNITMLIWLGKQSLGQTDKQETTHSGELGVRTLPELIAQMMNSKKKI